MTIYAGKGLGNAVFLDFDGYFDGYMSVEERKVEDYAKWLMNKPKLSQVDIYLESHPKAKKKTALKISSRYFKSAKELFSALPTKKKLEYLGAGDIEVIIKAARLMDATKIVFSGGERQEIPDNTTQIKAVELCANMNGLTGRNANDTRTDQMQCNANTKIELVLIDKPLDGKK